MVKKKERPYSLSFCILRNLSITFFMVVRF
jgi:hypothetical protein